MHVVTIIHNTTVLYLKYYSVLLMPKKSRKLEQPLEIFCLLHSTNLQIPQHQCLY